VAKQKRNVLDDLATRLRGWLDDMERLLNAGQPRRARVPVPVPVPRSPKRSSYR